MEMREAKTLTLALGLLFILSLYQTVVCEEEEEEAAAISSSHIFAQSPSPPKPPNLKKRLQRIILGVLFGCLTGLVASIILAFLIRFFILFMNQTPILKGPVVFSPKVAPKTLQLALLETNENLLLGSSPNGKYYKTALENALIVAVKRLEPMENGSAMLHNKSVKRKIQHELELLATVRHRNLMSLRAYVRESHRFSLVYDYVPTGSLEDAMDRVRANQLELSWEARHRIAVGVIKGLQYLHFNCTPRILHYNLKPRNVLLDAEFEPRLGDSGLAHLMPNFGRLPSAYTAPECFQNCRYTEKSDIFSFGVILGVLLTGRDPLDPFFGEVSGGGSLGRWLRHLQQAGEAKEALDKSILGEEVEEDEMLMAVRIAVVCLSDLPADRPSSDELVPMLTQLHSF